MVNSSLAPGFRSSSRSKALIKRVVKKALLSSSFSSIPKGHVCVYVGSRKERFVIPISYLSHSFFQIMLLQSQETFEFGNTGALIIPCRVPLFESILDYLKNNSEEDVPKPVESYKLLKCVTDMNLYK